MAEADQPAAGDVAVAFEIGVLGRQLRVEPGEERPVLLRPAPARASRSAASACSGGWVRPEVSTPRGAAGCARLRQNSGPGK